MLTEHTWCQKKIHLHVSPDLQLGLLAAIYPGKDLM